MKDKKKQLSDCYVILKQIVAGYFRVKTSSTSSRASSSIAGSVLAQSAWKRVLYSMAILILLWLH
ncbi:hypothetical protein, partial [Pseudomonas syringae group genomosp. 7]|uniref:hypothetical protein n=1 Tax=Pseudomonas syringae group genomosp. 7 TaxID=251699 RepID=UPI0037705AA5